MLNFLCQSKGAAQGTLSALNSKSETRAKQQAGTPALPAVEF